MPRYDIIDLFVAKINGKHLIKMVPIFLSFLDIIILLLKGVHTGKPITPCARCIEVGVKLVEDMLGGKYADK